MPGFRENRTLSFQNIGLRFLYTAAFGMVTKDVCVTKNMEFPKPTGSTGAKK
jgi:hypothetical protein